MSYETLAVFIPTLILGFIIGRMFFPKHIGEIVIQPEANGDRSVSMNIAVEGEELEKMGRVYFTVVMLPEIDGQNEKTP